MTAPPAVGRVLPTMNEDGTRRWLRPKPSRGQHWARRRVVAYVLMLVFFAIPHLRVGGKPMILLDVPRRQFTLFGATFLPTDTLLLMFLLASVILAVFLLTALFGRVWCGWACPQTVYMEWLFRPLERLIEGGRSGSLALDRRRSWFHPRRLLKYAVYVLLALFLAHTFLAYFVGTAQLTHWVTRPPSEHPAAFVVMAVTAMLIFADFTYFREQVCIVACPYGRWQSVLLDRQSLIVAYDAARGEPRMKHTKSRPADAGDCIDCGACVLTCPTGIDIRDGLQMECIHCTQCADACDSVMQKIGKPTGLIRYSSRDALEGKGRHFLRPRVVLYPAALALFVGGLVYSLATRSAADVTLLRGIGEPFTEEPDGRVANQIRIKIANRTDDEHAYTITAPGLPDGSVIAPENPLVVAGGDVRVTSVFVLLPASAFHDGEREVVFRITGDAGFAQNFEYELVGPEGDHDHDRHDQRAPAPAKVQQ